MSVSNPNTIDSNDALPAPGGLDASFTERSPMVKLGSGLDGMFLGKVTCPGLKLRPDGAKPTPCPGMPRLRCKNVSTSVADCLQNPDVFSVQCKLIKVGNPPVAHPK